MHIEVRGLNKSFGDFHAVKDVSFDIEKGKLIGLLNLFLGMIGAPEVPDLSNLAGTPLDEAIPPIDAIIETLQSARAAVPVP